MSFIKFKEEQIWKKWKEKEEEILRKYGVNEDTIKVLYEYDWYNFKRNRSFGEHQTVSDILIEFYGKSSDSYVVESIENLLDMISNEDMYKLLKRLDPLTLNIVHMRYQGYSSKEISKELHITVRSIDCKIYRLKKKYKNK